MFRHRETQSFFRPAFLAASMSDLVSPTVTASAGEMPPSFFNEAAKMSGAGLELSASSAEVYPFRDTRGRFGKRNVASGDRQRISTGGSSAGASRDDGAGARLGKSCCCRISNR